MSEEKGMVLGNTLFLLEAAGSVLRKEIKDTNKIITKHAFPPWFPMWHLFVNPEYLSSNLTNEEEKNKVQ